ncbi:MAG: GHKL domain-containing protein, partial [Anaerolineales bacterium]|nr:GHKL domain-containing protein [Anaerolineales bacterium]
QMKSLFLSMAAHDLRSPLTAVAGYTELLQKNGEMVSPTKRSEFLTIIQTQVKRLNRLIDDILNLDQIERGLLQIERLPVDLNQLVQNTAADFAYLVARNQHNLQTNLTEDALVLPFDESKMQQVLYNLLSNAVKYTPHGGEIQVTTRREGETAVIEVADTGLGMTAEQVSHLFELYYRSDEVRSRKIQGTGLGLFIVRSLVEAHGGTISVQSEPDAGSVFTISLPL